VSLNIPEIPIYGFFTETERDAVGNIYIADASLNISRMSGEALLHFALTNGGTASTSVMLSKEGSAALIAALKKIYPSLEQS